MTCQHHLDRVGDLALALFVERLGRRKDATMRGVCTALEMTLGCER